MQPCPWFLWPIVKGTGAALSCSNKTTRKKSIVEDAERRERGQNYIMESRATDVQGCCRDYVPRREMLAPPAGEDVHYNDYNDWLGFILFQPVFLCPLVAE